MNNMVSELVQVFHDRNRCVAQASKVRTRRTELKDQRGNRIDVGPMEKDAFPHQLSHQPMNTALGKMARCDEVRQGSGTLICHDSDDPYRPRNNALLLGCERSWRSGYHFVLPTAIHLSNPGTTCLGS